MTRYQLPLDREMLQRLFGGNDQLARMLEQVCNQVLEAQPPTARSGSITQQAGPGTSTASPGTSASSCPIRAAMVAPAIRRAR
jgi:hypothetical protein